MLYRGILGNSYSGSVDGLTASHCRGSKYFRARSVPTDPATPRQQALRDAWATAANQWQSITTSQRESWSRWAAQHRRPNAIGEEYSRNGQQEFMRHASFRYYVNNVLFTGYAVSGAAPTPPESPLSAAPVVSIQSSGTVLRVVYPSTDAWCIDNAAFLSVFVSAARGGSDPPTVRPLTPTVNYFKGPFALLGIVAGNSATPPDGSDDFSLGLTVATGNAIVWRIRVSSNARGLSTIYDGRATR
jgi:hypothetical protein